MNSRRSFLISTFVSALALAAAACAGTDEADTATAARSVTTATGRDLSTPTTTEPGTSLRLEYSQEPPTVGAPVCRSDDSCVIPFSLFGDSTGDFEGTTTQAGGAVAMPDGALYANSTLIFTGTVRGCGTGTVVMRSTGFNRADVTSGVVEIVEGSGSGDLAGITGSGVVVAGEAAADGTGNAHGTIEIDVQCA